MPIEFRVKIKEKKKIGATLWSSGSFEFSIWPLYRFHPSRRVSE